MATAVGFTLFATPIGLCGLAWNERAIIGVRLPEAEEAMTRERLARRYPGAGEVAPPGFVRTALEGLERLLSGQKPDLSGVPLDFGDAPPARLRIYEHVRAIPPGRTMTYGEVARALGHPLQAAQAVGQAMGANPCPLLMPCHRVLGAGGKLGGFSAPGGAATKLRLLEIEGALPAGELPLFSGGG